MQKDTIRVLKYMLDNPDKPLSKQKAARYLSDINITVAIKELRKQGFVIEDNKGYQLLDQHMFITNKMEGKDWWVDSYVILKGIKVTELKTEGIGYKCAALITDMEAYSSNHTYLSDARQEAVGNLLEILWAKNKQKKSEEQNG